MQTLRHSAMVLALFGGLLLCAAGAHGQDARERMARMAAGPAAGPAAVQPVSVVQADEALPALPDGADRQRPLASRASAAASRDAEALPAAGSRGGAGGYVLPTLAALGVVIGLLYGLKAVAAKLGGFEPARASPAVEVLSRTAVGPKGHVLLLRVGGRVLVVGDSAAGGLRTLDRVEGEEEVAELLRATSAAASPGLDFGALLTSAGRREAVESEAAPDPLAGVKARLERLGGRA